MPRRPSRTAIGFVGGLVASAAGGVLAFAGSGAIAALYALPLCGAFLGTLVAMLLPARRPRR